MKVPQKTRINSEDLDDIIGIADQLQERDMDVNEIGFDELKAVALELDISVEHVQEAMGVLKKRREDEAKAEKIRLENSNRRRKKIKIGLLVAAGIISFMLIQTHTNLSSQIVVINEHRSAVKMALDRQKTTRARYEESTSENANAELMGAENRVRVAQRRHDEAVSVYNDKAGGLAKPFTGILGFKEKMSFSSEIKEWN